MEAAAYLGLRLGAATGLPMVSILLAPCCGIGISLKQDSSWSSGVCRLSSVVCRLLGDESYFALCLDAGEGGLLLFVVTFGGEGDEAVDELFVGDAGGLP
jgi:hypothetical protein